MAIHNNYITIAKALGIIFMVAGHSVCPDFLSKFIYLFHMPLFFFCSGLFFSHPTEYKDLRIYIQRKISGLYFPFILWGIISMICHNILLDNYIYYYKDTHYYQYADYFNKTIAIIFTMTDQEPIIFQFWFLKQLFLSSVIVSSISFILYRRNIITNQFLNLCTLLLLSIVTKRINLQIPIIGDVSLLLLSTTFFYTGAIYSNNIKIIKNNTIVGFICITILMFFTYITPSKIEMLNYTYKNAFLYFILAELGIFMILHLSIFLEKNYTCKALYYIGNHTMVIFIWHLLAFRLASLIKTSIYGYPIYRIGDFEIIANHNEYYWIIYTITGVTIPLSLFLLYKKIVTRTFAN